MYKSSKKKINGGAFEKAIITTNTETREQGGVKKDVGVCNIYTSYTLADIHELGLIAEKYIKIKYHIQNKKLDPEIHPSVNRLLNTFSNTNDILYSYKRIGNPDFIESIIKNHIYDSTYTTDVKDVKNYINKLKENIDLQLNNPQCNNSSIIEVNIVYEKYSSKSKELRSQIIDLQSLIEITIKNTQIFLNDIAAYITKQLRNKKVYISFWYDNESFTPSKGNKESSIYNFLDQKSKLEKATEIGQEYKYPENLDEETIQKNIQAATEKVEKQHPNKFNQFARNIYDTLTKGKGGNGKEYATYKGRKYIVRIGSKGGKYILVGTDKKKVYI